MLTIITGHVTVKRQHNTRTAKLDTRANNRWSSSTCWLFPVNRTASTGSARTSKSWTTRKSTPTRRFLENPSNCYKHFLSLSCSELCHTWLGRADPINTRSCNSNCELDRCRISWLGLGRVYYRNLTIWSCLDHHRMGLEYLVGNPHVHRCAGQKSKRRRAATLCCYSATANNRNGQSNGGKHRFRWAEQQRTEKRINC